MDAMGWVEKPHIHGGVFFNGQKHSFGPAVFGPTRLPVATVVVVIEDTVECSINPARQPPEIHKTLVNHGRN